MLKHVIISSLQSAFFGSLLFTIFSIPFYGMAAMFFGLITFPLSLFFCLIFAYPLIKFRHTYKFPELIYFFVYVSSGFTLGVFTSLILVGNVDLILGVYGLLGAACSITAWNYVRNNVPYNKPFKQDK